MEICYMFPGQGTQKSGMLNNLMDDYNLISNVFELASDISHKNVKKLCLEASDEELKKTENTQIVVTAMNLAYYLLLKEKDGITPTVTLGHSLGQFSALVAARSVSIEDTFKLVTERARLMGNTTQQGVLCTIIGLNANEVHDICNEIDPEGQHLAVAIYNTEKQIVIGGFQEYVDKAKELADKRGAVRALILRVSNAFHTPLMGEMVDEFTQFVEKIEIKNPKCKLLLNCKGDIVDTSEEIKKDIIQQCCNPVQWYELTRKFEEMKVAEVGVGKVLTGMLRHNASEIKSYPISNSNKYKEFVSWCKS